VNGQKIFISLSLSLFYFLPRSSLSSDINKNKYLRLESASMPLPLPNKLPCYNNRAWMVDGVPISHLVREREMPNPNQDQITTVTNNK
jgi:hypothetical protein